MIAASYAHVIPTKEKKRVAPQLRSLGETTPVVVLPV